MNEPKNLRQMVITTESGKDVTNTDMLSGEAKTTKAENATNVTKQYETSGSAVPGPWGGKPSGK